MQYLWYIPGLVVWELDCMGTWLGKEKVNIQDSFYTIFTCYQHNYKMLTEQTAKFF